MISHVFHRKNRTECFRIPVGSLQKYILNKKKYHLKPPNFNNKITSHKQNKYNQLSLKTIEFIKKTAHKFPKIGPLIRDSKAIKGLEKLKSITGGFAFVKKIQEKLTRDPASKKQLLTDMERISKLNTEDIKEIRLRLKLFYKKSALTSSSLEQAQINYLKVIQLPETHFKFARSFEFRQTGPLPNHVTNHLKQLGYTDQNLKEVMALTALPSVCLRDQEFNQIWKVRMDCPMPQAAYRIIQPEDVNRYVSGEFNSISGFWTNAIHSQQESPRRLIYDLLNIDHPESKHNANEDKLYMIRFSPIDLQTATHDSFANQIKGFMEKGGFSTNTFHNLMTNGFTAAREPLLIPEFYTRRSIPLIEEKTCIGYLDKNGAFHEQYMFHKGKWVNFKQYESHKEIEKLISTIEKGFTQKSPEKSMGHSEQNLDR